MQIDRRRIQAHRGASGLFPENTLCAFREAYQAGITSIETDLSLLADGALAIFHDPALGRTVTGTATITSLTAEQVTQLDAGAWRGAAHVGESVPLMRDILDWQQTTNLDFNWEMKIHGDEQQAAAKALATHLEGRDLDRSIISSFDAAFLAEIRSILPALSRALIVEDMPPDWREMGKDLELGAFHLDQEFITPSIVRDIHDAGYLVRVYTVNEQTDMERMIVAEVDVIISDYPERWL